MAETTATYDRAKASRAQTNYCDRKGFPHFAPDDKCYRCRSHIYDKISVERAGSELITGCPYCHASYCD